jgi:hypothetical protein
MTVVINRCGSVCARAWFAGSAEMGDVGYLTDEEGEDYNT